MRDQEDAQCFELLLRELVLQTCDQVVVHVQCVHNSDRRQATLQGFFVQRIEAQRVVVDGGQLAFARIQLWMHREEGREFALLLGCEVPLKPIEQPCFVVAMVYALLHTTRSNWPM